MTGIEKNDGDLVAAYRGGDRDALAELVHRYFDRMERYGHRVCGNREDAEEVLQETFAVAIDALPGFRHEASVKNWFYKVAQSLCIKKRRRKQEESGHDAHDVHERHAHLPSPTGDRRVSLPEELIESDQLRTCLERALASLPDGMRRAVTLVDFEGHTHEEAAEMLGLTAEALRVRLHRGRAKLREGARCR